MEFAPTTHQLCLEKHSSNGQKAFTVDAFSISRAPTPGDNHLWWGDITRGQHQLSKLAEFVWLFVFFHPPHLYLPKDSSE
jgi:hypothetical protein